MASITTRKRKDGSSCLARVQEIREGTSYHETKTFDRRPAATAWIKKREKELAKPGALEELNVSDLPLSKAIERYTEETVQDIARTKAQALRTIATCLIAVLPCSAIKSKDIIEFLQSLPGQPQAVGNYASHLASIFAIARPMWDFRLDDREMRDAITVARRLGIISRFAQRNRRPTLDELDRLLAHFIDRRQRTPKAMPLHKVIVFALFSTRHQAEITRLTWVDSRRSTNAFWSVT